MKYEYMELQGYIGLYQGTLKKKVCIRFGNNKIIVIKGPNGSGKTTLLKAVSVFPDKNSSFIPGEEASKMVIFSMDDIRYKVNFVHGVNNKLDRLPTRAYIKKEVNGSWMEMNPTGLVSSFNEYMESELDLDPNFVSLTALSTEDKGIVEKTPSERMKYVNKILDGVQVYTNMNKVFSKRSTIYKSLTNNLIAKIDSIGNEVTINGDIDSLSGRIATITNDMDYLKDTISQSKAAISLIDPDGSIQNLYNSVHESLQSTEIEIIKMRKHVKFILDKMPDDYKDKEFTLDEAISLYSFANGVQKEQQDIKSNANMVVSNLLVSREESLRAIQLKQQRIASLKSEMDMDTLENTIALLQKRISEYEHIFEEHNIKNAISITKEEYISGLNIMHDIKDMIGNITSSYFSYDILAVLDAIANGTDIPKQLEEYQNSLEELKCHMEKEVINYEEYDRKLREIEVLSKRPEECNISHCPFIARGLEYQQEDIPNKLSMLIEQMKRDEMAKKELEDAIVSCKNRIEILNYLNIILRNIENSKNILAKLPNKDIFLDRRLLFENIANNDFTAIDDLYQLINYANMFEEYQTSVKSLEALRADYKIYQSKNETILEISKDIDELNTELNGVQIKIEQQRAIIEKADSIMMSNSKFIEQLDSLIAVLRSISELEFKKRDDEAKIATIQINMEKINTSLEQIKSSQTLLAQMKEQLDPLENEKNALKYSLRMLKQYKTEYEEYNNSYKLLGVLKSYTTPTQKSIQSAFIKLYMSQALSLGNELLGLFFGGNLVFMPYDIDEEEGTFSIPCYSKFSGITANDISYCSKSQRAMGALALSGALLKQSSSKYNILKLDELDEGLDEDNLLMLMQAVERICDILQVEQFFMISHSSELNLHDVDVITLRGGGASVSSLEGSNIICQI